MRGRWGDRRRRGIEIGRSAGRAKKGGNQPGGREGVQGGDGDMERCVIRPWDNDPFLFTYRPLSFPGAVAVLDHRAPADAFRAVEFTRHSPHGVLLELVVGFGVHARGRQRAVRLAAPHLRNGRMGESGGSRSWRGTRRCEVLRVAFSEGRFEERDRGDSRVNAATAESKQEAPSRTCSSRVEVK